MKKYDESKSTILIHIPKTAGISVKQIYQQWFSERLYYHYFDGANKALPAKQVFDQDPVFIYGHFNRSKQFGIEHYYPEADQFVSILRDPFEMAVSGFFYARKVSPHWKTLLNCPTGKLEDYLHQVTSGLLNFFPQEVTFDNYRHMIETQFVEIGVTEHLDESMRRIATQLNQEYRSDMLPRLNTAERDQRVPQELKAAFIDRHPLEFAVYHYVLSKYE